MLLILVFASSSSFTDKNERTSSCLNIFRLKYFSSVGKLVFFLLNNNVSRVKISLTAV